MSRPLYEIAADIRDDWQNVYFGAVPYLNNMFQIDGINDLFFMEDGRTVVLYFLSNAKTWRGEKAREIKKELNELLKGK